jgi:hypothetical protein
VIAVVLLVGVQGENGRGVVESVGVAGESSVGGRCYTNEALALCLSVMVAGLCLGSCRSVVAVAIARNLERLPLLWSRIDIIVVVGTTLNEAVGRARAITHRGFS